jgi:macrodomain Ter protein organizer (MatP/YcbG family)
MSHQQCHSVGFYLRTRARENLKKKPRGARRENLAVVVSVEKQENPLLWRKEKSTMRAKPKRHEENLERIREQRRKAIDNYADALQFEHDFGATRHDAQKPPRTMATRRFTGRRRL